MKIIEDEGNSVWTWYAVNLAGPHQFAERKIDRIVANPPWVKLSDKLSAQPMRQQRRMVLYPASADIMRGARIQAGVAVVDPCFGCSTRSCSPTSPAEFAHLRDAIEEELGAEEDRERGPRAQRFGIRR